MPAVLTAPPPDAAQAPGDAAPPDPDPEPEPRRPRTAPRLRAGTLADLDGLLALEQAAFAGDRLTRRGLRHLLTRAHGRLLVATRPTDRAIVGAVLVLLNRATTVARLYSIAVDACARRQGLGRALVAAAEAAARAAGRRTLRLEVRIDNAASQRLFESLGYRRCGRRDDYYEDHAAALRYQKALDQPAAAGPWRRAALQPAPGQAREPEPASAPGPARPPRRAPAARSRAAGRPAVRSPAQADG